MILQISNLIFGVIKAYIYGVFFFIISKLVRNFTLQANNIFVCVKAFKPQIPS